ncbi:MAG: sigma-54-dependent Fis family transcriptional regulator [Planctomycetes bacterium]|nr:sigma-54-dependent Fis family transcriptional regulator [Planctomycetota bacterium]
MRDSEPIDLLVVDDDPDFRSTIVRRFLRRGYHVEEAANGEEALGLCGRRQFDVMILDMVMPGLSGIEVLEKLKENHSECEVIMLTGQGTIEIAVQAMKLGAFDFLSKPFPLAELEVLIEKAYDRRELHKENKQLKAALKRTQGSSEMIGNSPAMQEVFRLIARAGPSDKAILIEGESGTGKELAARALHQSSRRADKPLIVINCAALPETLLESELFGHEKGAFTGAISAKPGLFEVADGGTLFIDEIGEMSGSLQAKLLRVLEDGSMRRVGSIKERRVDVRLLAATNRNLTREVQDGRFREDLFYRINVMSLCMPPLRNRNGDIALLVKQFLGTDWQIAPEAMRMIERYDWPGNIRQLSNALERAKIMGDGHLIGLNDLPSEVSGGRPALTRNGGHADGDELASIERAHIVDVLTREGGNKARASRALGINRRSLYRLIDKYEIRLTRETEQAH